MPLILITLPSLTYGVKFVLNPLTNSFESEIYSSRDSLIDIASKFSQVGDLF